MKKISFAILAVLMAVLMVASASLQVFAASKKKYLSDVMVATADTLAAAKALLKKQGYTPLDQDLNESHGKVVCLGYKTTTDPDEAITDLAIMNMEGGYSFEDYEHVLEEYQETADQLVGELSDAVAEYRANYKAGKINALVAHEQLNRLYDNDFGTNNKLGDILASDTLTDEQLSVIFLQATALAVTAIECLLGMACADNWLDRLLESQDEVIAYTTADDDNARAVYKAMATFQEEIASYEKIYNASGLNKDSTAEEWDTYYQSLDEDQQNIVANYAGTCDYLKAMSYKDGTLYDLFMQDLKELDNEDLYPVAHAMTAGQVATVPYAGLANTIQYALCGEETMQEWLTSLQSETNPTMTDVFAGVDRSIFSADGIALTNEALRQATSAGDYSWYQGNLSKSTETIYYSIIGASCGIAALGAATAVYAMKQVSMVAGVAQMESFSTAAFLPGGHALVSAKACADARAAAVSASASSSWSVVATAAKVITVIAIAVFLVALAIFLNEEYKAYKKSVDYSDIPRIIVDQTTEEDGTHSYVYYYAALDTNGEYADLNAWSGDEWNALYYTKDAAAGNPILADCRFETYCSYSQDPDYDFAVHAFGSKAAYNLNRYTKVFPQSKDPHVYAFFKTEARSTLTGTAVSGGTYGLVGGCGLLIGAAAVFTLDRTALRKTGKKKEEAQA